MLIKKVGYLLILKTKFYKLIPILAPILMILSILLIGIVPHITQKYQFQQPILRTKLTTPQLNIPSKFNINYRAVYPGINIALIYGRLTHETILLVSKCKNNESQKLDNHIFNALYYNIEQNNKNKNRKLAKNIGFLCYNQSKQLNNFISLIMNPQQQNLFSFQQSQQQKLNKYKYLQNNNLGIIRISLSIQNIQQQYYKNNNIKSIPQNSRLYFNKNSKGSQLHIDTDYYQAIKQLLQQVGLNKWQPCQAIDENKIINKIIRYFNKKSWNLFLKHTLCQFYQTLQSQNIYNQQQYINNNHIFQQNSIQSATLSYYIPSSQLNKQQQQQIVNKLIRVLLSFVQQFVVLQDHLHSANTLYVPLSQLKWVPLKGLLIPGMVFLVITVFYLVWKAVFLFNKINVKQESIQQNIEEKQIVGGSQNRLTEVVKQNKQQNQQLLPKQQNIFLKNSLIFTTQNITLNNPSMRTMLTLYFSIIQYYINSTILYSIFLIFIIKTLYKIIKISNKDIKLQQNNNKNKNHIQLIQIIISGINILLCQYFSLLSFPLSILLILCTNIICFVNKYLFLVIFTGFIIISVVLGMLNVGDFILGILRMSLVGQVGIYGLFIWIFII